MLKIIGKEEFDKDENYKLIGGAFGMDWLLQVLLFGLVALFFSITSVSATLQNRYALGLCVGILELLSATISASAWAYALKISGKMDWFLLGLLGYTPIALIFMAMFVVGILCVLASIRGLIKKEKSAASQHCLHSSEKPEDDR